MKALNSAMLRTQPSILLVFVFVMHCLSAVIGTTASKWPFAVKIQILYPLNWCTFSHKNI